MAPSLARDYYVDLPPAQVRAFWADFEHELSYPSAALGVQFSEVAGAPGRTRVSLRAGGEQSDEAMRRFRLFLASRGVIRIEPPLH
jgi:hypothetical protein